MIAHHLRGQHRAGGALELLPGAPVFIEHQLAIGTIRRHAILLIQGLREPDLAAIAQCHGRNRQFGIRQDAMQSVGLRQNAARGCEYALGLDAERMWRGAQRVVEEIVEARLQRLVLGNERANLRIAHRQDLGCQPGGILGQLREQRLRLLVAFEVGAIAQVLVG
jgi:hypothetical protein